MAISSLPSEGDGGGDAIVAEINITPLTDVFLVLLIIFMVTASAIQSQGKNVNLPEAAAAGISGAAGGTGQGSRGSGGTVAG